MNRRHYNADGTEKVPYTRAGAVTAARRFPESEGVTVYACGSHWHVGHTPAPRADYSVMTRRDVSPDPWQYPPLAFDRLTARLRLYWRRWVSAGRDAHDRDQV